MTHKTDKERVEEFKFLFTDKNGGYRKDWEQDFANFIQEVRAEERESNVFQLAGLYGDVMQFAHSQKQVIGKKNDYYVTLEQFETLLKSLTPKD